MPKHRITTSRTKNLCDVCSKCCCRMMLQVLLFHMTFQKCDVPEWLQRSLVNMEVFMFEDKKLNGDMPHVWKCKHAGSVTFRRRWICVLVLGPMFGNGNILETCLCRRRWLFVLVSQLNSPWKCYKSHMIVRVLIKHNIQSKCR